MLPPELPVLAVIQHLAMSLKLLCLAVLSVKPEAKDSRVSPSISNLLFLYHHKQSQGVVKRQLVFWLRWEEVLRYCFF